MSSDKKPVKKQVMDVAKPGKTPADATTRPIIVGHKPEVQDPMMATAEDNNPDATPAEPVAKPAVSKKIIEPLSPSETTDESTVTEAETPMPTSNETAQEPASVATEDEPETTDSSSSDAAVVDAVVDQVGDKQTPEDVAKAEEERQKQEAIDKLVAEKKYFIPIGKLHHKSNKAIWIVTLVLLLILLGLLLAIDAGVLDAGFSLPFDLIK